MISSPELVSSDLALNQGLHWTLPRLLLLWPEHASILRSPLPVHILHNTPNILLEVPFVQLSLEAELQLLKSGDSIVIVHHEIEECWASLRQFLGQAFSVSVADVFQLVGSQAAAIPRGSIDTVNCLV